MRMRERKPADPSARRQWAVLNELVFPWAIPVLIVIASVLLYPWIVRLLR